MDYAAILPAPAPILTIQDNAIGERLCALFEAIMPPGNGGAYGTRIDITTPTQRLSAHPYCWCDGTDCPWCASHLDPDTWSGSAHALLDAPRAWENLGFVTGQGAPNLWFCDTAQGIDIRLWWYKYIGRGMHGCFVGVPPTAQGLDPIAAFFDAHAEQMRADETRATLLSIPGLEPALGALIQATPNAHLPALQALVERAMRARHEEEILHNVVDAHSRIPRHNRQNQPLSLRWRVKTALENAKPSPR